MGIRMAFYCSTFRGHKKSYRNLTNKELLYEKIILKSLKVMTIWEKIFATYIANHLTKNLTKI